jgi:hypothetical protein
LDRSQVADERRAAAAVFAGRLRGPGQLAAAARAERVARAADAAAGAALRDQAQGNQVLQRHLAAQGLMRAVEIGDATWCDIDTLSDLAAAETALGAPSA